MRGPTCVPDLSVSTNFALATNHESRARSRAQRAPRSSLQGPCRSRRRRWNLSLAASLFPRPALPTAVPAIGTILVCLAPSLHFSVHIFTSLTVSLYSSGSAPQSGYNSPAVAPYQIPRDPNSQSPPMESTGIRLPNAPLNDIATLNTPPSRRESPYFQPTGLPVTGSPQEMYRRASIPGDVQPQQTLRRTDIPEVTGWQSVPMSDLGPTGKLMRKNSIPTVRKVVAA